MLPCNHKNCPNCNIPVVINFFQFFFKKQNFSICTVCFFSPCISLQMLFIDCDYIAMFHTFKNKLSKHTDCLLCNQL